MAKKKLMIKEIRQLEAELIENRNNSKIEIDLTETGGHSLLGLYIPSLYMCLSHDTVTVT